MDGDATTPLFTIDLCMADPYGIWMDTRKFWFIFRNGERVVVDIPQGRVALDKLRGKLNKIHSLTNWDSYKQSIRPLR